MLALPHRGSLPVAVFVANIVGAFLLGVLLESLAQRGPEHEGRTTVRLLLGTGLLGGFTTYSALAQAVALLFQSGEAWVAAVYGLAMILLGAIASWFGMLLSALPKRSRCRDD